MADTAVHSLTAKTTPVATDEMYLVQSPFGSGDDRRATLLQLGTSGAFTTFQVGVGNNGATLDPSGGFNLIFSVAGTQCANLADISQLTLKSIGLSSNGVSGADTILVRDAANTLALRNGVNSQTFRVYNTFTDASNYIAMQIQGTSFTMVGAGTGAGGTDMYFGQTTNNPIHIYSNNVERWTLAAAGHWLAGTDNTYDIGASGATRPRTGYFGTGIDVTVTAGGGSLANFSNGVNGNFVIGVTGSGAGTQVAFIGSSVASVATQFGPTDVDLNSGILAQTIRTQGALTGGTSNQAGKNLTLIVSPGKGTGVGGSLLIQTAPAGGSGSTPNAPVTALTIDSTGLSTFVTNLRINVTPTANVSASTLITSGADSTTNLGHRISFNLNGTTYWIPCSTGAF